MTMDMPKNVDTAINLLQSAGFEAYAVGGCVRDSLLGKIPNDWDITTSAKPEDMKSVFADFHCIDTGIKHGTVTVVIDGEPLEITTFRLDGEYEDNRHPKSVTFTADLGADLGRRDFTVNAMAYSKKTGTVDLFDGQNDLKNKIIRCVGDPDRRFNEDALRILRALRFASALDFEIEEKTAQSLLKNCALLGNISEERIAKELLKLVCGKGAKRILTDFAPVLFEILPELQPMYKNSHDNPHHCYDIYEHTLIAVESIDPEPTLRFAMLLHDCGKPAVKNSTKTVLRIFTGISESARRFRRRYSRGSKCRTNSEMKFCSSSAITTAGSYMKTRKKCRAISQNSVSTACLNCSRSCAPMCSRSRRNTDTGSTK